MIMGAGTKVSPYTIFQKGQNPFSSLRNYFKLPSKTAFGIIISNLFNTKAIHANLIFSEKIMFKLFNVILPKSKQSTYTCLLKKWPASALKFYIQS